MNDTKEEIKNKISPARMFVKPIKSDGTFEIRFTKAMKYPKSWYDKVKQDSKKSKERYEQLLADSISS